MHPDGTYIAWALYTAGARERRGPPGYFVIINGVQYGPWTGVDGEGYPWDVWEVHDRVLQKWGVCPFPSGNCPEDHKRPEEWEQWREEHGQPWDHSDLPLFAAAKGEKT